MIRRVFTSAIARSAATTWGGGGVGWALSLTRRKDPAMDIMAASCTTLETHSHSSARISRRGVTIRSCAMPSIDESWKTGARVSLEVLGCCECGMSVAVAVIVAAGRPLSSSLRRVWKVVSHVI
ncbi:hypothetical protein GGS23DRAFT_391546 [Durotheca rogersii]|uniref:uncharacterized protein n=1 Tax=Durotheca rogersii TaxID=419775 RepID=UPI00221FA662|nr:uncharacterized protein GGS23DRAFT_391546 [Durotheca rogersii]KAI5856756.1 hypothetical protein GGS23DRAFT_391546 [Durotheca rogersii]